MLGRGGIDWFAHNFGEVVCGCELGAPIHFLAETFGDVGVDIRAGREAVGAP